MQNLLWLLDDNKDDDDSSLEEQKTSYTFRRELIVEGTLGGSFGLVLVGFAITPFARTTNDLGVSTSLATSIIRTVVLDL